MDFLLLLLPSFSFLPLLEKILFFSSGLILMGRPMGVHRDLLLSLWKLFDYSRSSSWGFSLSDSRPRWGCHAAPKTFVPFFLSNNKKKKKKKKCRERRRTRALKDGKWNCGCGGASTTTTQQQTPTACRPFEEKGKKFFYLIPKSNYRKRTRRTDLFFHFFFYFSILLCPRDHISIL